MGDVMGRLIILPQYPTPLRYQEWWYEELPKNLGLLFDKVIRIGGDHLLLEASQNPNEFAPLETAMRFELEATKKLLSLKPTPDDCVLLCDLSFPGIATSVLMNLDCRKFAICHATSLNRHDYFQPIRHIKWPIEKAHAQIFEKVFVGSKYHAEKLGWPNTVVAYLPLPPIRLGDIAPLLAQPAKYGRTMELISVARSGRQKVNKRMERRLQKDLGLKIHRPEGCKDWKEYIRFLRKARVMVITSQEETFGYQVIDALRNGVYPLAPRKYSYPELLPRWCLYEDYNELVERIKLVLDRQPQWERPEPYLKTGIECSQFYETIANHMRK